MDLLIMGVINHSDVAFVRDVTFLVAAVLVPFERLKPNQSAARSLSIALPDRGQVIYPWGEFIFARF
ncbi:hypothetical protein [Amycolatopsis sp. NPDC021455]|uniref:hypothetical protein n=1 Tax=Amycolatopsis sp. NPDC021455 TaxID=3154901 RepID=UPI0033E87CAF